MVGVVDGELVSRVMGLASLVEGGCRNSLRRYIYIHIHIRIHCIQDQMRWIDLNPREEDAREAAREGGRVRREAAREGSEGRLEWGCWDGGMGEDEGMGRMKGCG